MRVSKVVRVITAALLVARSPVPSHATRVQRNSKLKVAVDLVLLDVSVQDKNGQPVRDLQESAFRVFEDKIEQRIASFSTEESPVTWGLVLDRSSSMQGMMKDVYEAAINVIDQGTTEDEMFIMTFNNRTEIVSELTSDRRHLSNSIFGLNAQGSTALYDAVDSALDYIKKGTHRKKVLVVVTDGGDNKSRIRFSRLIDSAKESDVLIYTVGMYGGMVTNPTEMRSTAQARGELKQLAETTGAYAHFPTDPKKCREVMDKIAREVSEHYTIGYYPANPTPDGKWRKLRISLVGQVGHEYIIRARPGYYATRYEK